MLNLLTILITEDLIIFGVNDQLEERKPRQYLKT